MMKIDNKEKVLSLSRDIRTDIEKIIGPPDEGLLSETNQVISYNFFKGTRGYLEKVTNQINGTYEKGWFDSCAVMIRRLLETLIIECFEEYKIPNKIKGINGDFLYLRDLINIMLNEKIWNLSRNTKKALPKLKDIGDKSAHSRRYNAHLNDIKDILPEIRFVVQELVYLAKLK